MKFFVQSGLSPVMDVLSHLGQVYVLISIPNVYSQ